MTGDCRFEVLGWAVKFRVFLFLEFAFLKGNAGLGLSTVPLGNKDSGH